MNDQTIEGFKLSPQQRRIVALQGDTVHRSQCAVRIDGPLDVEALQAAIDRVAQRHEILRTAFPKIAGMSWPLQSVRETAGVHHGGDPDAATGLHAGIARLDAASHLLTVSVPSLCADVLGLSTLVGEIAREYDGVSAEDEPMQYVVASEWLNDILDSEEAEAGRSYWRGKSFMRDDASLPFERHATAFRRESVSVALDAALAAKLASVGEMKNVLFTAWQLLLWKMTGETHMLFGYVSEGRPDEELRNCIGHFERTLPVQSEVDANASFATMMARVAAAVVESTEWQECFEWSDVFASRRNCPFGFSFMELPESYGTSASFRIDRFDVAFEESKLMLSAVQRGDALELTFSCDAERVPAVEVQRTIERFQVLLAGIAADAKTNVGALELMSAAEREQVLVGFNKTAKKFEADDRLHRLFELQAARTPHAAAAVFGETMLTYAQLDAKANQLANRLVANGVGNGSPVGIYMERSLELVVAIFGILKAGGAYLPLDAEYPQDRLAYMLENARVAAVVTQPHLGAMLENTAAPVIVLDPACSSIAGEATIAPAIEVDPEQAAYVLYTSGSTGRPKGVVIPHRAICNHMLWMQSEFPMSATDAVLQKTPFSFDASVWEFYAPLLAGGRLVIAQPGGHRDAAYLAEAIRLHHVTVLQCVPTQLRMLLDDPSFVRCTSLRRVFCGGEALTGDVATRFHATMFADLINLYGPTEATIDATSWTCVRGDARTHMPIGRPVANTQVYVVDAALRPVPAGIAGELLIGGSGLALGYLHNEELTGEKFVANTIGDGSARLYRTGDLVRMTDADVLDFLGRIDHQIKLRGFRIELGEIEAVLVRQQGVKEAVVIAREDTPGDKRLVGYFIAGAGAHPSTGDLKAALKATLPDYMIPAALVPLDVFPLLPNGKIDTRSLPVPDYGRAALADTFIAPRTDIEKGVASIWSEVLGVEKIGVYDSFFELGGHSLIATQLISRIRVMFDVELPLRKLFDQPTVEALALAVEAARTPAGVEVDALLAELEGLSEDQVRELLGEETVVA
ncbi:MAG TPA: amino acid adenylation domain-containing protein [Thermoanaerobaculia bacterium]|nr:amino acid adenylation domain-containing protein [Thermoanaerobaculia bacterium]